MDLELLKVCVHLLAWHARSGRGHGWHVHWASVAHWTLSLGGAHGLVLLHVEVGGADVSATCAEAAVVHGALASIMLSTLTSSTGIINVPWTALHVVTLGQLTIKLILRLLGLNLLLDAPCHLIESLRLLTCSYV